MSEVLGKPPRQGVVATNDVVARHRNHQRDHHHQISTAVLRTMTPLYGMRKNSAAWVLWLCIRAKKRRCSPFQPGRGRARTRWRPTKNELSSEKTRIPRVRQDFMASATQGDAMNHN